MLRYAGMKKEWLLFTTNLYVKLLKIYVRRSILWSYESGDVFSYKSTEKITHTLAQTHTRKKRKEKEEML